MARRQHGHEAGGGVLPGEPLLISTRAPGKRQLALARFIRGVLFSALVVTLAFRDTQLARLDAFVPVANSVVGLNDLLTAALLYSQFSLTRAPALLVLASGFLFKTLILIPHAATFPGVFSTNGLLGAQLQTTAWLYPSQQVGFALCAIVYTILMDREQRAPSSDESAVAPIVGAVVATITSAVLLTWVLIAEGSHLPPLIAADGVHVSQGFRRVVIELMLVAGVGSIVVLRRRPKSMIDLWLQLAVWSWLFEAILTALVPARFSLVFYVVRGMGIVSSSFVLLVLLSESSMLHRRLVLATAAREQDREGHRTAMNVMIASLAHELRQPLGAMMLNGHAGTIMVATMPSDLDEVRAAFSDISKSAERASEIIDSVRTVFAHSPRDRVTLQVNDVVREVVDIMRLELEALHVDLELDLHRELPPVRGHHGQLTQVLINGVKNGIESLATIPDRERRLRVRTAPIEPNDVEIRIEDSGRGLDPLVLDRVFEPFYSTKRNGMGLGLAICKSIIERHDGALSLLPGSPHGAVFQVELPALAILDQSRDVPRSAVINARRSAAATSRSTAP
jgi:signal transduction histidine kinase